MALCDVHGERHLGCELGKVAPHPAADRV